MDYEQLLEDAWLNLNLKPGYEEELFNPLASENIPEEFQQRPYLYYIEVMGMPEFFSFFCHEILNIELLPCQALFLEEMWNRKFPMYVASRGFGKSFSLALYAVLRAVFMPGRKIVITGAAFRQSKVIFEYIETIWKNAPRLRNMFSADERSGPRRDVDMCRFYLGESTITALPIGDGSKIRGQRANDIIGDEFASISQEIFENVIAGFAAVASSPIDNVKESAKQKLANRLDVVVPVSNKKLPKSNQIVISGTAYYDFNHFADYWKKWKTIINTGGDKKKMSLLFQNNDVPLDFDWRDYSIIRMPYELIPDGFMDAGQVARSRATIHQGIYEMEFGAVFSTDSNGYFKRSLIELCSVSHNNKMYFKSYHDGDEPLMFTAVLRGHPNRQYVYGIDPASEVDHFSIVILELHPDHTRIVYCWTTMKSEHRDKIKSGYTAEKNFNAYCARKIRDLMKVFPCVRIGIDSQGGGHMVMEALHDEDKMLEDEQPIWEVIDRSDPKDSDYERGLHLVDLINFASAEWTSQANNDLRKDFEDRVLLFPYFDNISLGLADLHDEKGNIFFDTLEECVLDIEELKDELAMIIMTQTPQGRDKWDTPEIKLPGGKKGRQRKDRYSALLMANYSARRVRQEKPQLYAGEIGNVANNPGKSNNSGPFYSTGPANWVDAMNSLQLG